MKFSIAAFAVALMLCGAAGADEKKVQGVDLVTDAAAAVVTKATALLSGNLEVTMAPDKDKAGSGRDYTTNALGEKVPKATMTKSGS